MSFYAKDGLRFDMVGNTVMVKMATSEIILDRDTWESVVRAMAISKPTPRSIDKIPCDLCDEGNEAHLFHGIYAHRPGDNIPPIICPRNLASELIAAVQYIPQALLRQQEQRVVELNAAVIDWKSRAEKAEAENAKLWSEVHAVKEALRVAEAKLVGRTAELAGAVADRDDLKGTVKELQAENAKLQEWYSLAVENAQKLQARVQELEGRWSSSYLAQAQKRIATLEAQLKRAGGGFADGWTG